MQAFPWDTAPSYILRDRDRVYGKTFRTLAADMQITEVLTAARSPWQNLIRTEFLVTTPGDGAHGEARRRPWRKRLLERRLGQRQ
jgi:hypothetical protein